MNLDNIALNLFLPQCCNESIMTLNKITKLVIANVIIRTCARFEALWRIDRLNLGSRTYYPWRWWKCSAILSVSALPLIMTSEMSNLKQTEHLNLWIIQNLGPMKATYIHLVQFTLQNSNPDHNSDITVYN